LKYFIAQVQHIALKSGGTTVEILHSNFLGIETMVDMIVEISPSLSFI
jgi:lipoate synthase